MKPPEEINVCGSTFEVRRKRFRSKFGDCDTQKYRIRYDPRKGGRQDTILHESIHGIDQVLKIGLKERQVRLLASAILATLKANPELLDFLMSD